MTDLYAEAISTFATLFEEAKAGMDSPVQTQEPDSDGDATGGSELEFKEEFNKLLEIDNEWRD